MTTQNENQDASHRDSVDPFPKPQTIPSGWDTSELLSAPRPAPVADEEDAAGSDTQAHK